jgi:tetratricopeptide (TPR) repeat protein
MGAKHLAVGLVIGALVGGTAWGQSAQEEARLHFRQGNELYAKHDYKGALEKYRRAKALYPSYKIDVNIGTALSALGRDAEAAEHYEDVLRRAGKVAPKELVDDITTALDALRKKLGVIEVSSPESGATVEVDGKAVGTNPLDHSIYLAPGHHRVRMRKEGFAITEASVELAAGDRKEVALRLAPAPRVLAPAGRTDEELEARRRRKSIWAYSTLAAAGACAVGAVALYGAGRAKAASNHELYLAATDPKEIEIYRGRVEAAKELWIGGHVLVGVGAAVLGLSIYHFATRPSAERRVGVAPLPGGAALTLAGGF